MKRIVTLIFTVLCLSAAANEELIAIRNLFYKAAKSHTSATELALKLKDVNTESSAVMMGYKSMSYLMSCYHSYNPYTKYSYFLKGKAMLESALAKDKNNVELHFLRLCVQLNTPSFLGYSANIEEDKLAIFNGLKSLNDPDLQKRIVDYTINAKKLSFNEKQQVLTALTKKNAS
jgi:hypothetical protein